MDNKIPKASDYRAGTRELVQMICQSMK